jgi:fluoroacetyl-CoA thioesterase
VRVEHLQPSPLEATVTVRAELVQVDGRLLRFEVSAEHDDGTVVGHGEVTRVVVDRDRFLRRL